MGVSFGEYLRNATLTVGQTSVQLSPARERKEIVITNTSTTNQIISIMVGQQAAVAGVGIILYPGYVYSSQKGTNYEVVGDELNVIASAGGATLAIFER